MTPRQHTALGLTLTALALTACQDPTSTHDSGPRPPAAASRAASAVTGREVIHYDATSSADYSAKWANIYGPLSMAPGAGGTLTVGPSGINARAVPFTVGADYSVYDHLKYIGISTQTFPVPKTGSLSFAVDITAATPGAVDGRVVRGCYGPPGSYAAVGAPCAKPYAQPTLEGQQAGVVLNMINFQTGQLFDWFVSGNQVYALIERLPTVVTGNGDVGLSKAYTQIVKVQAVAPGTTHHVAIRYTRGPHTSRVEYFLDGELFAAVDNVGIPLDAQGAPFTGIYSSFGAPGEALASQLDSFAIGHGLFSLLDAYPFQHPERPDLSVSIPLSERLFGQGADGTWKNFTVTIQPGLGAPFVP